MALAVCLLFERAAHAQVEGCPEDNCVESETSLVFNSETNMMDAFTTATTDYTTSYWYDLCVDLAVGRLNGPYLVNATNLIPSGYPMCVPGAIQLERSGSVAATPGRQYHAVGLAELRVYFEYSIWVPFPTCGPYCEGYWYDALGYSQLITTQPTEAGWPSIVYTYPFFLVPVPVVYREIAMAGSAATAWSPPRIDSVTPNQWSAGATTTFTITGAGFGYSPDLAIAGSGVTGYTNLCSGSPSCDTQIVATVTIDASTPGGVVETITVTANGLNPSGYLPVPITGQSGQTTAQATTLAFAPPVPQIWLNGTANLTNNSPPSCPGNAACVFIGQKIVLTATIDLPPGASVQSRSWSMPQGTVVGGYKPSSASATVQLFPDAQAEDQCQRSLANSCVTFYWVDQAASRTLTFSYMLSGGQSNSATVTFDVGGPTATGPNGAFLTGTVQSPPAGTTPNQIVNVWPGSPPYLGFGKDGNNPGIYFDVTASGPTGAGSNAAFQFVQLITQSTWKYRSRGYDSIGGLDLGLDSWYPYPKTTTKPNQALDFPNVELALSNGDPVGEAATIFGATMYIMWDPALPSGCAPADKVGGNPATPSTCTESIPVPLGKISWSFSGNTINMLGPQLPGSSNGTGWIMQACGGPNPTPYSQSTAHPTW